MQALALAIGVSSRTLENYRSGATLPVDLSCICDTLFADDPRHAVARVEFIAAFNKARGVELPTAVAVLSNVPIRIPTHFMGREESLAEIEVALQRYERRVAITALHGLRGVGKTVLAAAYAERHRADYRVTWWLRAQTEPTMRADLVALGMRLSWVPPDEKEEPALAMVMERLRHKGESILLIFDNATDADTLKPYLPRGGSARVLVTSTAPVWRGIAEPVEIREWPKEIGADFLIARTGRTGEREAAEDLSEALGGLPLAHEQAGAYCERLAIPLAEYRRRLAAAPVQMLDATRDAPVEYAKVTVAKTFALAVAGAAKLHPAAEPLLVHAALMAPVPIPLFVFAEAREQFSEPLASMLVGDGVDEAVAVLRSFALVERETIFDERDPTVSTDTIRLHRLIREVAGARCSGEQRNELLRTLAAALSVVYPSNVFNDPKTWPRARRLDAIALGLGGDAAWLDRAERLASDLIDRVALYRQGAIAELAQAWMDFERALAILAKPLDDSDVTTSLSNAALLRARGDLGAARPFYERVLAAFERAFGPEYPSTAASVETLASLLRVQANLTAGRPLLERALAISGKALGP